MVNIENMTVQVNVNAGIELECKTLLREQICAWTERIPYENKIKLLTGACAPIAVKELENKTIERKERKKSDWSQKREHFEHIWIFKWYWNSCIEQ